MRYLQEMRRLPSARHLRAEAVLDLVDWRQVNVDSSTIRFQRPNMAITLNGIAQGYITDRVSVIAGRAVIADGLSTAIAVARPSHVERLLKEG